MPAEYFNMIYIMKNSQKGLYFKNRQQAGELLGAFLEPKYSGLNPLIIGIPRGGVEVAFYVAKLLKSELSLIISKKLPFPGHGELGFGAVAEEHSIYISPMGMERLNPKLISQSIEEQEREIKRRVETYRHGKPIPDLSDRTVILVDDGIATGVTLVPVLNLCRRKKAFRVIIAAPVSGMYYDKNLQEADAVEILTQPESFHAVGQVYEKFGDFTDDELLKLLSQSEQSKSAGHEADVAAELRIRLGKKNSF